MNIITLEQAPIVSYSLVEQRGKEVAELIESLDLDNIEATEDNLRLMKTTRADLSKEFKTFEEQRKIVKDLIMKPYNDFDDLYKKKIADLFKDADAKLKSKIDVVDDGILQKKIDGIVEYFKEENGYDFISFDDLGLKIIKSRPDKQIKEDIDEYLQVVASNLSMIETLENRDRVLIKYQMHKDINRAISETQIEVKREADMKAQEEERQRRQAEEEAQRKQQQEAAQAQQEQEEQEYVSEVMPQAVETAKVFKSSFTVYGTREQFAELKEFMQNKGIRYE